ncbi:MAG: hypothetical protein IT383_19340 [Deltaproteobacteria bacterium]|nr:hypothetical protein [Deltaproteobacteria bacterium]
MNALLFVLVVMAGQSAPPAGVDASVPTPAPVDTVPAETAAPAAPSTVAPPAPAAAPTSDKAHERLWDDLERELEMTAEGGIDVCEALSLPLSLIPGVGDAVGTISEWLCLVPAALAVDYVAVHHGGRDAFLWQAAVSMLAGKLVGDALDTPFYIVVGAAILAGIGVPVLAAVIAPGTSLLLPTLLAVGGAALLVAPLAWVKDKIGEWIFTSSFFFLTNQVHGDELQKARDGTWLRPGLGGSWWARPFVLMGTAAGTRAERDLVDLIPIWGRWTKATRQGELLKERMRRVGTDVLLDPPGRELAAMDVTIDVLSYGKAAVGSVGQATAIAGLGVGLTGVVLPMTGATDQQTGDIIGFTGFGLALAGLGIYALGSTLDTVRTFAVPCAYGCFAPEPGIVEAPSPKKGAPAEKKGAPATKPPAAGAGR